MYDEFENDEFENDEWADALEDPEDLIPEDEANNYTVTIRCDDTGVELQTKVHVLDEADVKPLLLRETGKLIKELGEI